MTDREEIARYHAATAFLTWRDRTWLRDHGWHDNLPKPYPEHGYTAEHFEPVYRIEAYQS